MQKANGHPISSANAYAAAKDRYVRTASTIIENKVKSSNAVINLTVFSIMSSFRYSFCRTTFSLISFISCPIVSMFLSVENTWLWIYGLHESVQTVIYHIRRKCKHSQT